MVKLVEERVAFGVPEITQVEEFKEAQAGSAVVPPLITQFVIAAPLVDKVVGLTDMATP
jgi:hypothetical protein